MKFATFLAVLFAGSAVAMPAGKVEDRQICDALDKILCGGGSSSGASPPAPTRAAPPPTPPASGGSSGSGSGSSGGSSGGRPGGGSSGGPSGGSSGGPSGGGSGGPSGGPSGGGSSGGGSGGPAPYRACSPGLYSTSQCCATDVLGVADLDCHSPREVPTSPSHFQSTCAAGGQRARCCVLPVAGQDLLCQTPTGVRN